MSRTGDGVSRDRLRVSFYWADVSGYMAACWRALAQTGVVDFDLTVVDPGDAVNTEFSATLLDDVPHAFVPRARLDRSSGLMNDRSNREVDVIVISGWQFAAYRRLAEHLSRRGVAVIMAMDNPMRSLPRALARRARSYRFFDVVDAVIVPGERGHMLALQLGFSRSRIYRGLYGIDYERWRAALAARQSGEWPRRFLYVGQLTTTKGVDRLLQSYDHYRRSRANSWPLTIAGRGPLEGQVAAAIGTDYVGFVPPTEQAALFATHGVFVIASRFDPWPLALVEACAAGLPVVCTDECGSAVEVVRPYHNGYIAKGGTIGEITCLLGRAQDNEGRLPGMGVRSNELASPYAADRWAERWLTMFDEVRWKKAAR